MWRFEQIHTTREQFTSGGLMAANTPSSHGQEGDKWSGINEVMSSETSEGQRHEDTCGGCSLSSSQVDEII